MNAHFFATKRAFHGILRITRKPLLSLGLTAARYDMMHKLLRGMSVQANMGYACKQSEMWRALGVTKSVVSRMLKSLEKLGWVTRSRPRYGDKRQRTITLTEAGLTCIRAAQQALARASKRLLCEAVCFGEHGDRGAQFQHLCKLESYLFGMQKHYGDTASLCYPWHPDD